MPINAFKCPNCGSPVTTTGAEKEVQCAYCGSTVIVPEELREVPQPQPQPMQYNFGPTSSAQRSSLSKYGDRRQGGKGGDWFHGGEFHPPHYPDVRHSRGGRRNFILCVFKCEFDYRVGSNQRSFNRNISANSYRSHSNADTVYQSVVQG